MNSTAKTGPAIFAKAKRAKGLLAMHVAMAPTSTSVSSGRRQRDNPQTSTEELLSQRDGLPAGHPDRARLRTLAIEKNLPMANRLARRYAGRGELLEDLTQAAAVALIRVVDAYDPSRGLPFASYAIPSILGAVKRHFRDTTWSMRVARPTQELARELANATGDLSQRCGRTPTREELADHLQVSVSELVAASGARQAYRPTSLNTPQAGGDSADLIELLGATDQRFASVDNYLMLAPLLAALPARERSIITMRFYRHMSQNRIAAEIGLSQMHVSRLLARTLARLRDTMRTATS